MVYTSDKIKKKAGTKSPHRRNKQILRMEERKTIYQSPRQRESKEAQRKAGAKETSG
jgi:hypothetical protein